jgi:ribosomal-protein-alanine N-acetyltransferase
VSAVLVPMRWWHIPAVLELERELFRDEPWSAAAFWSELADPETRHYVVALRPGQASGGGDPPVVGYAGLAVYAGEAHVLTLGVARAEQRRGLGATLLRDLLVAAERSGAGEIYLDVRADNLVAQRLYAKHGFVPIGVRRRYYQPSGTDAIVMARGSAAPAPAGRRSGT